MINLLGAVNQDAKFTLSMPGNARAELYEVKYGAFTDGEIIGRIRTWASGPTHPAATVQLEREHKFNVAFSVDGPGRGLPVAPTLKQIADWVSLAAESLRPYLPDY